MKVARLTLNLPQLGTVSLEGLEVTVDELFDLTETAKIINKDEVQKLKIAFETAQEHRKCTEAETERFKAEIERDKNKRSSKVSEAEKESENTESEDKESEE